MRSDYNLSHSLRCTNGSWWRECLLCAVFIRWAQTICMVCFSNLHSFAVLTRLCCCTSVDQLFRPSYLGGRSWECGLRKLTFLEPSAEMQLEKLIIPSSAFWLGSQYFTFTVFPWGSRAPEEGASQWKRYWIVKRKTYLSSFQILKFSCTISLYCCIFIKH